MGSCPTIGHLGTPTAGQPSRYYKGEGTLRRLLVLGPPMAEEQDRPQSHSPISSPMQQALKRCICEGYLALRTKSDS